MLKELEREYVLTKKGKAVEFAALSFDYLGGKDVMPVGGYWGPYRSGGEVRGHVLPNLLCEQSFCDIAEVGVNMIVRFKESADFNDDTDVCRELKYGEKYHIGIFPQIAPMETVGGRDTVYKEGDPLPFGREKLQALLQKYAACPAFLGVSLTDEPFRYQIPGVKEAYCLFREMGFSQKYTMYTNVLNYEVDDSTRGGARPGEEMDLDSYYDSLFKDIGITFLSATGYYFTCKDTSDETLAPLFDALSGLKRYAEKYKVPLWRMLQAGGQWNDLLQDLPNVAPYPDEGETLFDVNIALAYGCKAIQYFPLVQPLHFCYAEGGTLNFDRCGIIGADGKRTRWFGYAKRANRQIAAVDHVLMNSANVGMIAHGERAIALAKANNENIRPEFFKDGCFRQLKNVKGNDCFVGCFDYKGGTALYVVNYDRKSRAQMRLCFDDRYGYEIVQGAALREQLGTYTVDLTLDAGEGALIVLK